MPCAYPGIVGIGVVLHLAVHGGKYANLAVEIDRLDSYVDGEQLPVREGHQTAEGQLDLFALGRFPLYDSLRIPLVHMQAAFLGSDRSMIEAERFFSSPR